MNTARCNHQTVSGSTVPVQWSLRWVHVKWSRFSNVRLNYSQLCHFNWLSILIFLVFLFNSRTWQVSVGPARNKALWRCYQRQSGGRPLSATAAAAGCISRGELGCQRVGVRLGKVVVGATARLMINTLIVCHVHLHPNSFFGVAIEQE